jgi:hypothetical protein
LILNMRKDKTYNDNRKEASQWHEGTEKVPYKVRALLNLVVDLHSNQQC